MKIKALSISLAIFSALTIVFPAHIIAQTQDNLSWEIAQEQENKISEEQVKALIENIKKANNNKDTETVIKYFAPFIYSEITVKSDSISETIELNGIAEHQEYLKKQYQTVKDKEELSESWQISISDDQQIAFISRVRLISITTNDGKKILISTDGKARLAIIDGELKVIAMEEVAEVDLRP